MRVFVSWSGERSKVLAQALKEWLPLVLHNVEPWMSEADVAAGVRWEVDIAKELEAANFGITCVTRDNVNAPWLLFEAGALAKSLQHSRVIPLLMDLDIKDITGPLARFQAKKMEKVGLGEVVQSINQVAKHAVAEARATRLFEALWPMLEEKIAAIPKSSSSPKPSRPTNDLMEELVASVRALETRLGDADETARPSRIRRMRVHPMMMDQMMQMSGHLEDPVGILMAASMVREDAPWLYELAMELYRAAKSGDSVSIDRTLHHLRHFSKMMLHGPLGMYAMELPHMLERMARRTLGRRLPSDLQKPLAGEKPSNPDASPE